MDEGLEKKYKGGWGKQSKEMTLKSQKLEKDLTETPVQAPREIKNNKKIELKKFVVEYKFETWSWGKTKEKEFKVEYETKVFEAHDTKHAKKLFEEWRHEVRAKIKEDWIKAHPEDEAQKKYIWAGPWSSEPHFMAKIVNIKKGS